MSRSTVLATCFVVTIAAGCVSKNAGPGLQEVRLNSIQAHVVSLYESRSPDAYAGVKQISYFVTHGVTGHRLPLLDPVTQEIDLPQTEGKPPAKLCSIVGLQGLRDTNVACLCEAFTFSFGDVRCNTYVLGWDEKRGAWGTLSSTTHDK